MKQRTRKVFAALLLWLLAVVTVSAQDTVTYVYTDPQGTPLAEADAKGNITATFEYTPYGTYAPQGTSKPGANPNGPGYTGHVNDPETSLVYMQARYYEPVSGRFLSVDPVEPSGANTFSFNRYAYADNNPIVRTDPDGRDPDFAFGVGVGLSPWISDKDKAFLQRVFAQAHQGDTLAGVGIGQSLKEVADTKETSKATLMAIAAKVAVILVNRGRGTSGGSRAGKSFTPKGKAEIDSANAQRNGGVNVCEHCGVEVVPGQRSQN